MARRYERATKPTAIDAEPELDAAPSRFSKVTSIYLSMSVAFQRCPSSENSMRRSNVSNS